MGDGQMSVLLFRLKVKAEVDLRSSTQPAFILLFVQVFRRKGIRRVYFTFCSVNGYHLLAFEASQLAFNLYVVAEAHFLTICSTLPSSEQLWRSFVRYNSKLFHWGLSPQSGRLS